MATSTIPNLNDRFRNLQQVPAGSSVSLTVADSTRAMLLVIGGSNRTMSIIFVSGSATGTVSIGRMDFVDNGLITAESPGSNQLTVSNAATGVNPNMYALVFTGSVTRNS